MEFIKHPTHLQVAGRWFEANKLTGLAGWIEGHSLDGRPGVAMVHQSGIAHVCLHNGGGLFTEASSGNWELVVNDGSAYGRTVHGPGALSRPLEVFATPIEETMTLCNIVQPLTKIRRFPPRPYSFSNKERLLVPRLREPLARKYFWLE